MTKQTTKFVPRKAQITKQISFGKQAIPLQLKNEMVYSTTQVLGTSSPTFYSYASIPVNHLYTNQPDYFTELSAIYNNYTVTNSKIEIQVAGQASVAARFGIYIDDNPSGTSSFNQGQSRPGSVTKFFNTTTDTISLVKYWNASSAFPGDALSNQDLDAVVSANPAATQYFMMIAGTQDSYTVSFYVNVKITYTVVWSNLTTL